jgi:phage gpG-like protein
MSGVEVSVDARELQALLKKKAAAVADLSPTMAVIAEQLVAAVNDEFETAGHGKWPPLAESTLRGRRGSAAQILVDTGRFAASIRADSGPNFAEAATDVSYAVYHVSDAPRSVIPLRNPFDVPDAVLDAAMQTVVEAITAELNR